MMTDKPTYPWRRPVVPAGLAEAAIALGLPVFPCKADKSPLTPRGFKDASADPAVIRRMFSVPGAKLIGTPTGAASGVVVVDIDIKDGARGMEWLNANSERLPFTRTHKTRSGGLHLLFLVPVGVHLRNSASRVAPGVDVRGEGGYIIVPPSDGYQVADPCDPADMPDWLIAACAEQRAPASGPTPYKPIAIDADGTAYGRAALEDACGNIANAPDGAKHEILNREAYSIGGLVTAGEIPDGTAWAGLSAALTVLRPRCRDFRAAHKTLEQAYRDGKGRPREVEHTVVVEDVDLSNIQPFLDKHCRPRKVLPVAPELFDVGGGFLQLFLDHCEASAISPQPFLALAAGISLVGTLAGRRYRTATNLRTNVMSVGIADSGAGKDHARKQAKRVLVSAGLQRFMGGEDIASGQALFTSIARHPAQLFQIDEFGDWMHDVLSPKAPAHKRLVGQNFKKLYSLANDIWLGAEYADQSKTGRPRIDVVEPHACVYGTTTPGQFWGAVGDASMHDGLMARILVFVSPCSYPDERTPTVFDPSPDLVRSAQNIAAGPGADDAEGDLPGGRYIAAMDASVSAEAELVPNTPGAQAEYVKLRQEQLDQQRGAEGTYITAIAGRLAENAMKLALIRAVSRNPKAPQITEQDVGWGRAVAKHCVGTLLAEAAQNIGENDYDRKVRKTLAIIQKRGPISENEMVRRHGFAYPPKERADILRDLVARGEIESVQKAVGPKGGRPTILYRVPACETPAPT
ncbi:MAG TPA: bifunctional DNA primase/polymerase [Acidocella sp.]|nr:bifunctional DNA primase/polymerase [Acidocella sp.]